MYASLWDVYPLYCVGMLSSLSENNSLLHSRHAQLQGDCNELEVSKTFLSHFCVLCVKGKCCDIRTKGNEVEDVV